MKKIISYFLQGTLLVVPIAITIYTVVYFFKTLDGWLSSILENYLGYHIPGLGIVVLFALITILGVIGQFTIVKPIRLLLKKFLVQIPLLNLLYTSLKDLLSAFVGKEKKFNTPVKVLINEENQLWKLGFVTKTKMKEIEEPHLSAVYFPHSYNFSGELFLIPNDKIVLLDIPAAQAMKFIVSGGITNIDK